MLKTYQNGNITLVYRLNEEGNTIGFLVVPTEKMGSLEPKNCEMDSFIHLKLIGDDYPGFFSQGHTMRGAESTASLQFVTQKSYNQQEKLVVCTVLKNCAGHLLHHYAICHKDLVEVYTEFLNQGVEDAVLEMLTSFSMGGLSPLPGETSEGMLLHRLRADNHLGCVLDSLPLERLWQSHYDGGTGNFRFGQIGSASVGRFFPFAALEDSRNGMIWGVRLDAISSWQLEVSGCGGKAALSGGIADREFGHWFKKVAPGEKFTTPSAWITAICGGIDELTAALVAPRGIKPMEEEAILPITFSEFYATDGAPSFEKIKSLADGIKGKGITYFVIDCGWYASDRKRRETGIGDWIPDRKQFPTGMKAAADYIRRCGMIPGIWFEPELVGRDSEAFYQTDHLLKRDGVVITAGDKRFWDMTNPYVQKYLTTRIIDLVRDCGFGYIKLDYQGNIGIGCDGKESLGEGLRQQGIAAGDFYHTLQKKLPGLVIEASVSCASRMEPAITNVVPQSVLSGTGVTLPIAAANAAYWVPSFQSQITAVARKEFSSQQLYYSIISAFLGRMCLSGDYGLLTAEQQQIVKEGILFYKKIAPVIKNGKTKRFGSMIKCGGQPEGYQAILCCDGETAYLVIHQFGNHTEEVRFALPAAYRLMDFYGNDKSMLSVRGNQVTYRPESDFTAVAAILK